MPPKKPETDPAMDHLQQEMSKMSTMMMEQRREGERVKSLELAVSAIQQSLDNKLAFLEPMRQQYLEGEEEKRRLREMVKGKMHQFEENPLEESHDEEELIGRREQSASGVASASTTKAPEKRKS